MDLIRLSSFAPVDNWGDALDEALKSAKKAPRHQEHNNSEPLDLRTSEVQDDSWSLNLETSQVGTFGPGAYSFSEALVRRVPSCPRFSRLERFKDPTLSQAAPPPAVPALVQEMEQDWGPRQGCRAPGGEVTLAGRRVKPLRHPRLHLGRCASSPSSLSQSGSAAQASMRWCPPRELGENDAHSHAGGSSGVPDLLPFIFHRTIGDKPPGCHSKNKQHTSGRVLFQAGSKDTLCHGRSPRLLSGLITGHPRGWARGRLQTSEASIVAAAQQGTQPETIVAQGARITMAMK